MKIEFDYCITQHDELVDDCYAYVELVSEEILDIIDELLEGNASGTLAELPDTYLQRFVNAALDDAITIYPNFDDETQGYAVMLSHWLPQQLVDLLPDELISSFNPEMFTDDNDE